MNVPHWRIDGSDHDSGTERTVVVSAPNETEALAAARREGVRPVRVTILPASEPNRNPPRPHYAPAPAQNSHARRLPYATPANGAFGPSVPAGGTERIVVVQQPTSAVLAALLSFLIPGVGQMYRGHVLAGVLWLIFTIIGYLACFIPGLILHVLCIIFAAIEEERPTVYHL